MSSANSENRCYFRANGIARNRSEDFSESAVIRSGENGTRPALDRTEPVPVRPGPPARVDQQGRPVTFFRPHKTAAEYRQLRPDPAAAAGRLRMRLHPRNGAGELCPCLISNRSDKAPNVQLLKVDKVPLLRSPKRAEGHVASQYPARPLVLQCGNIQSGKTHKLAVFWGFDVIRQRSEPLQEGIGSIARVRKPDTASVDA